MTCMMLCFAAAWSQKPYYDATYLRSEYNTHAKKITITNAIEDALAPYYPAGTTIDAALLDNNPFFKDKFVDGAAAGAAPQFLSTALTAAGNLNVTNIADGIARFLVERSKEELNVAFFRRFQEFIKSYPELQLLFPTTSEFLKNIHSYQYAAMLPALKAAFEKDLNALCGSLLKLSTVSETLCHENDKTCKARMNKISGFLDTKEGRTALAAIIVADNTIKGRNAAETINSLATNTVVTSHLNENVPNLILFTNLVSQSLRSIDENRVWIRRTQADSLVNDTLTMKLYMGLLYEQNREMAHPVSFNIGGTKVDLQKALDELASKWGELNTDFRKGFAELAQNASMVADNAKAIIDIKSKGEKPSLVNYASYASSLSAFLKSGTTILAGMDKLDSKLPGLMPEATKYADLAEASLNVYYDIQSRSYSSLIIHTSVLLEELYQEKQYPCKDKFMKYGIFMASVADAGSSDEVKNAIEAAVLPVGSSSIKRETNFNVALNGYIGLAGGTEFLPRHLKSSYEWRPVFGVAAPVGVAFSWGNLGNGKRTKSGNVKVRDNGKEAGGKSFSIFVPLIDVGALATFRLGDDSANVASDIQLKNIIAPGLYLYYGLGKCPVSIGFGGQVGPQLRTITAKSIELEQNVYVRFGINIVVDIPFFNLYTKPD